jgi:hypothetical protein
VFHGMHSKIIWYGKYYIFLLNSWDMFNLKFKILRNFFQINDKKLNLEKIKMFNKLKYKGEDLEKADGVVTKCEGTGQYTPSNNLWSLEQTILKPKSF